MELIGKWKLVSAKKFDLEKSEMIWVTNDDLKQLPDSDYLKIMADAEFVFDEEGKMNIYMDIAMPIDQIPEDELKEALDSGEVFMIDGRLKSRQSYEYKTVDQTVFTDSGERGEVFGEAIDPFRPVIESGNTLIINDSYQIVKDGETPSSVMKTLPKEGTAEMKAAAGTYKGIYTKAVGSPDTEKNTEKAFTLILNPDGTGTHSRNDLEIKVPDWTVENGEFKMTEKFLGTIDYTGRLENGKLNIFNGDPTNAMTYEYAYIRE